MTMLTIMTMRCMIVRGKLRLKVAWKRLYVIMLP